MEAAFSTGETLLCGLHNPIMLYTDNPFEEIPIFQWSLGQVTARRELSTGEP